MEKFVILSVLVLVWNPLELSAEGAQVPDFCNLFPQNGLEISCSAYIPQFFYNSTSQECEEFIYGGCRGNQNRFDSKKKCMETCNPHPLFIREMMPPTFAAKPYVPLGPHHRLEKACTQAPESGPCLGYFPQFFYNESSNKCEIFIYGGCGGNRNRFESLAACQLHCKSFPSTEVCNLPPETGPCKAAFPRLYYNPESQRCEPFIYGGCEGNDNRFESIKDCMRICHPEGSDVITPLVLKALTNKCNSVCILPPEPGLCRAYIPRYFYNYTSHKCEKFIYGGCGGNGNKFVSLRECYLTCHYETEQSTETLGTDPKEACLLPPKTGPCEALIPRYYYNHKTQKCEEFNYGGCKGNQNNFVDEKECMKTCKKD